MRYFDELALGGEVCKRLMLCLAHKNLPAHDYIFIVTLDGSVLYHLLSSQSKACSWWRTVASLSSLPLLITYLFLSWMKEMLHQHCIQPSIHAIGPERRALMRLSRKLLKYKGQLHLGTDQVQCTYEGTPYNTTSRSPSRSPSKA